MALPFGDAGVLQRLPSAALSHLGSQLNEMLITEHVKQAKELLVPRLPRSGGDPSNGIRRVLITSCAAGHLPSSTDEGRASASILASIAECTVTHGNLPRSVLSTLANDSLQIAHPLHAIV